LDAVFNPEIFLPVLLSRNLRVNSPRNEPQPRTERIAPTERIVIRTYQDPVLRTVAVQSQIMSRSYDVGVSESTWTPPSDFSHNIGIDLSPYENINWDGN
jgi:hypothetical protein